MVDQNSRVYCKVARYGRTSTPDLRHRWPQAAAFQPRGGLDSRRQL